jgi:hypothetical protein
MTVSNVTCGRARLLTSLALARQEPRPASKRNAGRVICAELSSNLRDCDRAECFRSLGGFRGYVIGNRCLSQGLGRRIGGMGELPGVGIPSYPS